MLNKLSLLRLFGFVFFVCIHPQLLAQSSSGANIATYPSEYSVDLSDWRPDFLDRCYLYEQVPNENSRRIQSLLELLSQETSLALPLLENAQASKVTFCIDDREDGSFSYYDNNFKLIAIKSHLNLNTQLIFLIHELRHVDLIGRGYCPSLDYAMKEMTRLTMATEADAQAVTTLAIWRLSSLGHEGLWQTLRKIKNYEDIALAFELEFNQTQDDLLATRAAFGQWYKAEWRPDIYYLAACLSYLDQLDSGKRLQSYELLPDGFFNQLCDLPEGSNYGCLVTTQIKNP